MARSRRVAVVLLAAALSAALLGAPAASAADEPTLVAAPESGPPGLSFGISGAHYQASTTYGVCLVPTDQVQCGYFGSDLGSFKAGADGAVPPGSQVRVPGVLAGDYHLVATAPGTGAIVATTLFSVTAPTLALDPEAGPGGLAISVTGSGYAPSTAYSLCIVPSGTPQCGGVGILLGDVTADAAGNLPASTTVTIPGQLPGAYDVGAMLKGAALPNLLVTEPFVEVAPTVLLNPATGPGGMSATLTGAGLAPGGHYTVCIVPSGADQCGGAGTGLVGFTADAGGAVPAGTIVTIPPGDPGDFPVGVLLNDSAPFLLGSVTFSRTAGTAPPATSPPVPTSTVAPVPSAPAASGPASAPPSSTSNEGIGGPILWILIGLVLVALIVGLVLSRRRRSAGME